MRTFKFEPNHVVRFNPPIGTVKHVQFDEDGLFSTDNEQIIERFYHAFDSVPGLIAVDAADTVEETTPVEGAEIDEKTEIGATNETAEEKEVDDTVEGAEIDDAGEGNTFACKKCDFTTEKKGLLMAHYRQAHPKED